MLEVSLCFREKQKVKNFDNFPDTVLWRIVEKHFLPLENLVKEKGKGTVI